MVLGGAQVTPVQDIQKVLPSWNATGDEEHAHLTNDSLNHAVAYCGYRKAGAHAGHDYTPGALRCSCGAPMCPACLAVHRSYDRTGAWEGPDDRLG